MLVLDRTRFLFSFAGACVGGAWTVAALRTALDRAAANYRLRVPGLAPRILARFPDPPPYGALLAFLVTDARLMRALSRPVARALPKRRPARKMAAPPAWLGAIPPLATEAALADWLKIDPARLRWYADLSGRNRH